MAGTDPGFDADAFRDAIRFAMSMGAPEDTTKRVTFRWTEQKSYTRADSGGKPWNFNEVPVATEEYDDVQVDCAVEFGARPASIRDTTIGQFDPSLVTVTVLDEQYEEIMANDVMPDLIVIDGNEYEISFLEPPIGLFEVTVYRFVAEARDES